MKFRKITALAGSLLMAGLTVTTAAAAAFPAPFVSSTGVADVAVVYGTNGGVSATGYDKASAQNVDAALKTYIKSDGAVMAGDVKLTENEVVLGGLITASPSDIKTSIEDNKLSTLKDDKFSWDDGTGSDDYNYHEVINVSNMKTVTTLNDEDLNGVALTNERGLAYYYVFDDSLNQSAVGTDDADTLYLTILGHEYEVTSINDNSSITVTTSEENSFSTGDTYAVAGKTVTVGNIFDGSVEVSVDGKSEIINLDGVKKIDGIKVKVTSIGYNSNAPDTSRAVLKIGEDLVKTYSNGDEYIGQDKDDPLWIWAIHNPGLANGYIGVTYNAKINDANDDDAGDSIKYVGEGYVLPDNYAAVTLDSLTDAAYQDLKFYFDDGADLYNQVDNSDPTENSKVLVIDAENEDSITVNGVETDSIYLWYNGTSKEYEVYAKDVNEDYVPTNKYRYATETGALNVNNTLASTEFATVTIGDTDLGLNVSTTDNVTSVIVVNKDLSGSKVTMKMKDAALEQFGANAEDADANDITMGTTDISTKESEIMDYYGIIASEGTDVQSEADRDELTLSVPEEQVYAQVTVSMGASVSEGGALGSLMIKDTEAATSSANNLVIVGGSCINSAAATVLGGAYCGSDFTAQTGVGVNEFMIKGYENSAIDGKFALVVAGYELADTTNAVTYLTNKMPDTSKEWKGTSATEATVQVA